MAKYRTAHNTYHEVPVEERVECSKRLFLHRIDRSSGYDDVNVEPECFVRAYPIGHEIASLSPDRTDRFNEIEKILHYKRNCSAWTPHTPAFGPKEHREDYNMDRTEQRRNDFELRLFELSQKVQEDSRAIALDSKSIAHDNKTIAKWIGLIVILLTIIQIWIGYCSSKRPIVISAPAPTIQEPEKPSSPQ